MQAESVGLDELSEPVLHRYLARRRAAGYVEYRSMRALGPLLDYLAPLGVLPVAPEQRRPHEPLRRLLVRARNRARARILGDVVDHLGFAPGGEIADDPLSEDDPISLDLVGVKAQRHRRSEALLVLFRKVDGACFGFEEVLCPLCDSLQHPAHVDRCRELTTDLDERGQLGG